MEWSDEKLCLQWNDFRNNIASSFGKLRRDKDFTDVTLVCEDGQQVEIHKFVLVSASPFFRKILKGAQQHNHPWIYMRDIKSEVLTAMVDFLYQGKKCLSGKPELISGPRWGALNDRSSGRWKKTTR